MALDPLDLVDVACKKKLTLLSKQGATAYRWKLVGYSMLFAVIGGALTFFCRTQYNATDISTALRGWVRLAYWVTLPWGPAGVLAAAWNAVRATRAKAAAAFSLKCPDCGTSYELSEIFSRRFNVTCPACYAVINGSAESHSMRQTCDYCGLEYFGDDRTECPGCRSAGGEAKCPHCMATIPRAVVCCVTCHEWLKEKESGFESGTASYDPTRFGPKLARTYAIGIWKRVAPVQEHLAAILKEEPDPKKLDSSMWGRIAGGLSEPTSILPKLGLAAQWMRRPGATVAEQLPSDTGAGLRSLEEGVRTCAAAGMKLEDALNAIATARRGVGV